MVRNRRKEHFVRPWMWSCGALYIYAYDEVAYCLRKGSGNSGSCSGCPFHAWFVEFMLRTPFVGASSFFGSLCLEFLEARMSGAVFKALVVLVIGPHFIFDFSWELVFYILLLKFCS
jgi:hypothetical protein